MEIAKDGASTGENILSNYEVVGPIGRGATCFVYKVRHIQKGCLLALKTITRCKTTASDLKRLKSEVSIHLKVKHKHVIQLYKCFQDKSNTYLLLEYAGRGELSRLLERPEEQLSLAGIRKYGFQLAKGIKYLHQNGIVHRDLKPANLFITEQGDIKIGDLGLAFLEEELENDENRVCGTPGYIPPEMLVSNPSQLQYGREIDVWSYGCTLYCMVKKESPFKGENLTETCDKIRANDPDYSKIHPMLADLIQKCLQLNPKKRPKIEQIVKHPFFHPKKLLKPLNPNRISSFQSLKVIEKKPLALKHPNNMGKGTGSTCSSTQQQQQQQSQHSQKSQKSQQQQYSKAMNRISGSMDKNLQRFGSLKPKKGFKAKAKIQRAHSRHSELPKGSKSHKIIPQQLYSHAKTKKLTRKERQGSTLDLSSLPASNISINRQSFLRGSSQEKLSVRPRLLNTKGLEPCSFMTRNGKVSIKKTGEIELVFMRKEREITISGDGMMVTIRSLKDDTKDYYKVEKMPQKYYQVYKYALEVINMINSKKPKWKFENKLGKFMLMRNQPYPNFEAYFKSGVVIVHQVSSETLTIRNNGLSQKVGLYNKDIEMLDAKLKTEVEAAMKYLKFFIQQGQLMEDKEGKGKEGCQLHEQSILESVTSNSSGSRGKDKGEHIMQILRLDS